MTDHEAITVMGNSTRVCRGIYDEWIRRIDTFEHWKRAILIPYATMFCSTEEPIWKRAIYELIGLESENRDQCKGIFL